MQPDAIFSVQWSAYMIFIVVIGGMGYMEGPIFGTIVFFGLQQAFSSYGVWYLVLIGVIAMASVVWLPRGLWGAVAARTDVRLFPVGYVVHMPTLRERVTRRVARAANPTSAPATVPRDAGRCRRCRRAGRDRSEWSVTVPDRTQVGIVGGWTRRPAAVTSARARGC